MYMAYGWPQVIPLEQGPCPSQKHIIYLKVTNRLFLVVSPSHLELWSSFQHKVRLGKYKRNAESLEREGENIQAVWSPDTKLIAILTSSFFLHIFKVQFSDKRIQIGGKQPSGLFLANVSLLLSEHVPFADKDLTVSNFVSDNKHLLLGLSNGSLYSISWKGEFYGAFELDPSSCDSSDASISPHSLGNGAASGRAPADSVSNHNSTSKSSIVRLELCLLKRLLFVLYSDGQLISCSISKKGLKQTEYIKAENKLGSGDAVCISVASDQQILAVGTRRGAVKLYDLAESASLIRTVSLYDWGYSMDDTGPVSCIAWTPDNSAFAVGWKLRGLTVWSVSGCRLMSTIRQIGLSSVSSPKFKPNQDCKYEPLMNGTSLMQWDEYGYRLYVIEEGSLERVIAFSFGKCCLSRGVSGMTYVCQVIYGEDRLLVVQSEDTDELKFLHLNLPVSYISQNWPVQHVAASKDGMHLAVAGLHGLILYDISVEKVASVWRYYPGTKDSVQRAMLGTGLAVFSGHFSMAFLILGLCLGYELLFYPRYHLDQSSLLCRKPLLAKPMVMDAYQDHILVTYRPFDVHIFHARLLGELSPSSTPDLQLQRELASNNHISSSDSLDRDPARCLILRTNGELSILDLDDGREKELTDSVELFWVTCGQSGEKTSLIEEISWLDYGHRGMQVWYPSPGADPFMQEDFLQLDPELEFDREAYPLGLLPNAGVVVCVSQRMSFSACTEFPCFEPSSQAQTILHCLLRHLLQRDKKEEALRLAQLSAEKPHFSHCLEWLLFTVFDAEISSGIYLFPSVITCPLTCLPGLSENANKNQISVPKHAGNCSLLEKTCDLIKNFPEYFDVVVSVARKTDGRHWADLFSAAGRSTELFEECFQQRWYRTAACYILVIAKLEGPAVSQYCALRLLQATLDESLYELAGELVRFLLRSGKEHDETTSDSADRLSPRFLGYFLFRSSYKKPSLDKSTSFKEQSAHVASVKNILESHASYLMSGKELSKLVAFVKGTQFDLVEYLQRERYGSARLENFASGLELIGQKLQMGRTEVLFDLFQRDMRLWKAYSVTLQSHPAFSEYHDLLDGLEKRLSSVANSQEK
ncbi:hypothetical protein OIU77_010378 [Salix suchowensis]|uniref:RIC1 C-terminal alpha solenoid region domain-containing protein n=1 Tax=Salix suchowensis TaxID=1278906 RepID=A0ABQ9A972_9ROSI|nr:hypothetical protein OIU77_010378 [Salix suchowensis]